MRASPPWGSHLLVAHGITRALRAHQLRSPLRHSGSKQEKANEHVLRDLKQCCPSHLLVSGRCQHRPKREKGDDARQHAGAKRNEYEPREDGEVTCGRGHRGVFAQHQAEPKPGKPSSHDASCYLRTRINYPGCDERPEEPRSNGKGNHCEQPRKE